MALTKVTYSMIKGSPINVLDYGAVGDGAANDTTAIQAAIAAATAGQTIVIPNGVFLTGALTCTTSIKLQIDGTLKYNATTGVMLDVTSANGFVLTGNGTINLNNTQYIGVRFNTSDNIQITNLTFENMLGGAASIGSAGCIALETCNNAYVSNLKFKNILTGTGSDPSQPRCISIGFSDKVSVFNCFAYAVKSFCTTGSSVNITFSNCKLYSGGVTNDNAFYIIDSQNVVIENHYIDTWGDEPIVFSGSTDCAVIGGVHKDCAGNSSGFENCTNITFTGTNFIGAMTTILKARSSNTLSTGINLFNLYINGKFNGVPIGFLNGATNNFVMKNCYLGVTYDTGYTFSNDFIELTNTDSFIIENNDIVFSEIAPAPAADYLIILTNTDYSSFKNNRLFNRTAAGRFKINGLSNDLIAANDLYTQQNIDAKRNANYGLTTAEPRVYWSDLIPAAGTYKVGDIVYFTSPIAGGNIGWVCTTAGTPGTWKTFGSIAP